MEIREHIIETASTLFYEQGYNSTGINEIIAKSEIAKATLYNHFRSKEDLCLEYLRYKNKAFTVNLEKHCNSQKKGSGRILALFSFLQKFFKTSEFNGCWCIKTIAELPKDNKRVKAEIQSQKQGLIDFIEQLIKENLRTTKSKSMARKIYLLYESAVSESHLHQKDWPIKEAKNICQKIIED